MNSLEKSFHSISFKESKADELIETKSPGHLDLIKLTQQHLVRIYPGAKRQDSSNINPILYWIYGKYILIFIDYLLIDLLFKVFKWLH